MDKQLSGLYANTGGSLSREIEAIISACWRNGTLPMANDKFAMLMDRVDRLEGKSSDA